MIKNNSTIRNFWIIFFAVLSLVAIASATALGVVYSQKIRDMRASTVSDENYYKVAQENNYRRALYSACDSMKNLDASLGKASISDSPANQTQQLTNAVIHANQVNQYLANLPLADSNNLVACQKFVNQTQDYAAYLLKRLAQGNKLSETEKTSLKNLDVVATELYNFLQDYAESDSGMFITNGNGMFNVGALSDSLGEVEENTFQYEKLIYDGPFSDSVQEKSLVCGKKISTSKGSEIVGSLFGANTFDKTITNKGVWYSYTLENGRVLLACDGRVAQFERYLTKSSSTTLSKEDCISRAEEFCAKLGYEVSGVWVSKTQEQTTYVNCAPVIDGVIVYPELIKVAVDSATGEIVGCEARAYLFNHSKRDVAFGNLSVEDARKALDSTLVVTHVAKALVQKGDSQHLCYEFQCQMGEKQYYVFVDSNTGEEIDIFKVIQNTEGYTVM